MIPLNAIIVQKYLPPRIVSVGTYGPIKNLIWFVLIVESIWSHLLTQTLILIFVFVCTLWLIFVYGGYSCLNHGNLFAFLMYL